jgi:dipeptidyl aminopeptidase/acylaminoacyl peptidase
MYRKRLKSIKIFFLLLISFGSALGQKHSIDTSVFYTWPQITSPLLSPNGEYCLYYIDNHPLGRFTVVVKSLVTQWKEEQICSKFKYGSVLNDNYAIFLMGGDSLCVVTLGQGVTYYENISSFTSSEDKNNQWIAALGKEQLRIIDRNRRETNFDNVLDYRFILGGSSVLLLERNKNNIEEYKLVIFNLNTKKNQEVWSGSLCKNITIDQSGNRFAFITGDSDNKSTHHIIIYDAVKRLRNVAVNSDSSNLWVSDIQFFTKDEQHLLVTLSEYEARHQPINKLEPRIWRYNDDKILSEKENDDYLNTFLASVNIKSGQFFLLQKPKDELVSSLEPSKIKDKILFYQTLGDCVIRESKWNLACQKRIISVDINDGSRKILYSLDSKDPLNEYLLSPDNKYIIFLDNTSRSLFKCTLSKDVLEEVGKEILANDQSAHKFAGDYYPPPQRGLAGWLKNEESALIYDDKDIWLLKLNRNEKPRNLTNGFGLRNNTVFSLLTGRDEFVDIENGYIITSTLDFGNKNNGFFKVKLQGIGDPQILSRGSYVYYLPFGVIGASKGMKPIKSEHSIKYIVQRESVDSFPNLYLTTDFKNFSNVSNIFPERNYKWINSELHSFSLPDGKVIQGILYKPQDFDSSKKYPIIFNIYEKLANALNSYISPDPLCLGCDVNPLVLSSNGYLIFKPDIYYKSNEAGECALTSVYSAVEYLSKYKWIDTSRMGIVGCSFGGYETNYIITHSDIFKAAIASSSLSDLISYSYDHSDMVYTAFNLNQFRVNKMIWEDSKPILSNSPISSANNVTTPLLLFHTTDDGALKFQQALEFYLVLRYLNKKVWLLQYGNASHNLIDPKQKKDLGDKMLEFFNFYLNWGAEADWMKKEKNSSNKREWLNI